MSELIVVVGFLVVVVLCIVSISQATIVRENTFAESQPLSYAVSSYSSESIGNGISFGSPIRIIIDENGNISQERGS